MTALPAAGRVLALLAAAVAVLALTCAPAALAAPLTGSAFDSGDGDQSNGTSSDWQAAYTDGRVQESPDANDDCFVGGVKELTPNQWAFDHSAGGCTPGKSNLRVAYANAESLAATTFAHFAFFRNDTTGNSFLTFELNQSGTSWTNATGTTIPCRTNGDLLLSYEVGGSTLTTSLYKWTGDGTGPTSCRNGAGGTFVGSGSIPAGARFQGTMNSTSAIANYVNPTAYGSSFPANSFGEGAVDLPAVLQSMGQSPCFGFVQMQVHSRSSTSISSAMIDYTTPVPIRLQSCAVTGTAYQDTNGNGVRDDGEPGVAGFDFYADLNDNGVRDIGEPTGSSDASGFYRILNVPAGTWKVREVPRSGWNCTQPSPCLYTRSLVNGGNSTGNDFGHAGPSSASGVKFNDLDADGVRDPGEGGLADWTFYVDLDNDGVADAGEPSAVSDASGAWSIGDVPSGTWTIREIAQPGWTCSLPTPCFQTRTFTSNSTAVNLDFGGWTTARAGGNVFEDVDGDGAAKEGADVSLAGWQVYDDTNANNTFDLGEPQTTTDASGNYVLGGLAPGAHTLRVTPASASWYCTLPAATAAACERPLALNSGEIASGQDFGHTRYASVSGSTFNDTSNLGIHDSGESALSGFTYWVDYDNDNALDVGEPSAVGNSSGAWTITGVAPGTWTLRQQPNGAYNCTKPASSCSYSISIASGASATGYEFGDNMSRSVSGVVFNDANANGVDKEAGESGLAGWSVYVDSDGNGSWTSGEPITTTNSLGQYSLTGLGNGQYKIRVVGQSGWTCSYPAGCVATGSLGASTGQFDTDKNIGVYNAASISGTVFEDLDGDGTAREAGEAGLAGRVVYVDSNGNGSRDTGEPSATSDANGAYSIAGLAAGTYTVRQVLPDATWACTRPSPCSYSVTVSTGANAGRDFGSYAAGSISGSAYEDVDADGAAKETGEPALAGRTVYIDTNLNGAKDSGEPSATTDSSGNYGFTGLAPGAYSIRQVLPANWTQSAPGAAHAVTIVSQTVASGRDFASYTYGSVSGTAFDDMDFDGSARQPGDALLAGRTVYVDLNHNGSKDSGEPVQTTAADGSYSFSTLAPGTYDVRAEMPADAACAYPSTCSYSVTVGSQLATSGRDFGSYLGASVSGTVFEDLDADGAAREPGEGTLPAQRVYLDANSNGSRDPGEPNTLTDADGSYSFSGLAAKAWRVRVDLGSGFACDSPTPCLHDVTLSSGASDTDQDFGVHGSGSIAGHLFTDRDVDHGPQVFGENDQPERDVYLDNDGSGTWDAGEPKTTTDDHGDYAFRGLEPGTYTVRQVLPADWLCSTPQSPCSYTVTLTSRQSVTGLDFSSWTTASFSGSYFEDANADGSFPEPTDGGLAGREVYIDSNDNGSEDPLEPTATTASDGTYRFTGLTPGSYDVRAADQPSGWTCSYPTPCATPLTLEAGERAQDVDVGAWTTGTVAGTVYKDADASGTRDAGEPVQSGWTVYADIDHDGSRDAGEPSDVTDASGAYELTLDPGSYEIRRVDATGWTCSAPSPCAQPVTVVSSGAVANLDFGNAQTAAQVSGLVYDDADADGAAPEPGDSARAGRTVFVDGDGDGQPDPGELQTTTAADGSYTLSGLTPGATQTLLVAEAGGRTCSRPDPCAYTLTPADGEQLSARDFGSWADASIAGTWWDDGDGDGNVGEPGEGGRGGATVYLDVDGVPGLTAGDPTATTASDGSFSFTGLRPGSYHVRAELPPGDACSTACSHTVTVSSGEDSTGNDFAAYSGAIVSGTVFEDGDADGTIGEAGESGRAGVTVYLDTDGDGSLGSGEPATTTDATGHYQFAVAPGAYDVKIDVPGDWTCSDPALCVHSVDAHSGENLASRDFGIWRAGSVAGSVVDDRNGDGALEAGEPGLAGQTVYLDLDGSGTRDAGEPTVTTDAGGAYTFASLRPRAYGVRIEVPPGRNCTLPSPCAREITLTSSQAATGRDFATHVPGTAPPPERPAIVSGSVFEDRDADGSEREMGEPALAGWTLYADSNGNGALDGGEPVTTTDADGEYRLSGLEPGAYTLRTVLPSPKWVCSLPAECERRVTLAPGATVAQQDFAAWRKAKVTGYKFEDANRDGSGRAPGDRALAGWTIYVDLDGDGRQDAAEPSDVTDAHGRYGITNLPLGGLLVREVPAAGSNYRCTFPADACTARITLRSGSEDATADFGAVAGIPAAVHRASVRAPVGCRHGGFRIRVRATLARSVVVKVDGRSRAHARMTHRSGRTFRFDAKRFRHGVHRVSAMLTFLDGTRRNMRTTFYRCRAARPRYTG